MNETYRPVGAYFLIVDEADPKITFHSLIIGIRNRDVAIPELTSITIPIDVRYGMWHRVGAAGDHDQ